MGKKWDGNKGGRDEWIEWLCEIMIEVKRVLKPGAHGFVWALPRTSHWTAMSLENAGFEIRDCIVHTFSSGFPKSHSVDLKMDKINGKKWQGYGTALKPACEYWWMVRKPLSENTVAENVLKWGTGALNIDDCRIPYAGDDIPVGGYGKMEIGIGRPQETMQMKRRRNNSVNYNMPSGSNESWFSSPMGRFPANLLVSDDVLGNHSSVDKGSYSRYFDLDRWFNTTYPFLVIPKASKSEKNKGCEKLEDKIHQLNAGGIGRKCSVENRLEKNGENATKMKNTHPCTKPIKLMSHLIVLGSSREGDVVLDPFAGSGTTLVAAKLLNRKYIGMEQDAEYCKIINARLNGCDDATIEKSMPVLKQKIKENDFFE